MSLGSNVTYLCRPWCEVLFMIDITSGLLQGRLATEYLVHPTQVHDEKCNLELTDMAARIYLKVMSILPDLLIQDWVRCPQWSLDISMSAVSAADAAL